MTKDSIDRTGIIPWSSPIPSFGDLNKSQIATVGINPSNLEFEDEEGNELTGVRRRFHTLNSLMLDNWAKTSEQHLLRLSEYCERYFERNPYDTWFKKLDYIISGNAYSYYFPASNACHLDLSPYATAIKWSSLSHSQRSELLQLSFDTLGKLLVNTSIHTLVLNGQSVVTNFKNISNVEFFSEDKSSWTLPRNVGEGVKGRSYKGLVTKVGGVKLNRPVQVLGFNHNIQSSFGVTKVVQNSIRDWITKEIRK